MAKTRFQIPDDSVSALFCSSSFSSIKTLFAQVSLSWSQLLAAKTPWPKLHTYKLCGVLHCTKGVCVCVCVCVCGGGRALPQPSGLVWAGIISFLLKMRNLQLREIKHKFVELV